MGQVNVPTDLERGELLAEKVDRREFIDLLKRMLTMDQVCETLISMVWTQRSTIQIYYYFVSVPLSFFCFKSGTDIVFFKFSPKTREGYVKNSTIYSQRLKSTLVLIPDTVQQTKRSKSKRKWSVFGRLYFVQKSRDRKAGSFNKQWMSEMRTSSYSSISSRFQTVRILDTYFCLKSELL